MKHTLLFVLLLIPILALATQSLRIGDADFPVEFENIGGINENRDCIIEDMEKIFAPLRHITNIVDAAFLLPNPPQCGNLTNREWYPEGFLGGVSITNHDGSIVFHVSSELSKRYATALQGSLAISNKVSKLNNLIQSLNNGSITNRSDLEVQSLVFLPSGTGFSFTATEARMFFGDMSNSGPFSVSILDFWNETVLGENCTMASAKAAIPCEGKLEFVPIVWMYREGKWMYCHPAILEATVR